MGRVAGGDAAVLNAREKEKEKERERERCNLFRWQSVIIH
jgi:hypothetical protein